MSNLDGFNAQDIAPLAEFEPLPAGKYPAVIVGSQTKPTKAANGTYLELEFEVIDGPCKGRKLWARLNLDNPSQEAVSFARGELSAICRAVGVLQPKDSTELHNLPLIITVRIKQRGDTGEPVNEIRGYAKRESAPPTTSPKTPSGKPWGR
jgi:hypothetical protein